MGVWWHGDVLRELLDGTTIDRWDSVSGSESRLLSAEGCARNDGTKASPCLHADILGDRTEAVIWRTRDNRELRIYTTPIPTGRCFYSFTHDPVCRLSVA